LKGEVDIDEGGHGLDGNGVLRVVEEEALAGLIFWVPDKEVELALLEGLDGC
jgi:hypothetical protein